MSRHVKFGGSTAARTIACPAWHRLSEGMPKGPESDAAKLGTALHTVLEKMLDDDEIEGSEFHDRIIDGVKITAELIAEKILPALDAFDDLMIEHNLSLEYMLEAFVEHPDMAEVGGTADFLGVSDDGKTVLFADYKSGDGVMVYADNNSQLLFYAWLALLDPQTSDLFAKCETVILAIVQPSDRRDDITDIYTIEKADLYVFGDLFMRAVLHAQDPYSAPAAGDHCKFCPVAAVCPAKTGEASTALTLDVGSNDLAALAIGMDMVESVEAWCKSVRKLAHEQMEQGVQIDGFKLVNKRGTRVWSDEEEAEDKARKKRKLPMDEIYNNKLLSPAQMEKLCKAKGLDFNDVFKDDVSSVSSGTTIARESDPRPEAVTIATMQRIANQTA